MDSFTLFDLNSTILFISKANTVDLQVAPSHSMGSQQKTFKITQLPSVENDSYTTNVYVDSALC